MKPRIKSMIWSIRKQKRTNQNNKKKKESRKIRVVSISSLWDNFKRSSICITGVPEGEEKEQEIVNLFEKIMKENFPDLVKEIDMQVQEAQRVPNKMDAKRPNIRITGVPEEEKEQEIGNLSEKTVKENFPNLMKEIDMQVLRSAESQF